MNGPSSVLQLLMGSVTISMASYLNILYTPATMLFVRQISQCSVLFTKLTILKKVFTNKKMVTLPNTWRYHRNIPSVHSDFLPQYTKCRRTNCYSNNYIHRFYYC